MKNPLRLFGLYQRASTLLGKLDDGRQDWDRQKADPTSTLYASAAWWDSVLVAARHLVLGLPVPDEIKEKLTVKNWKTTLSGISGLLALAVKVLTTGEFNATSDLPVAIAAIGLIFAKDANVTGGTVPQ